MIVFKTTPPSVRHLNFLQMLSEVRRKYSSSMSPPTSSKTLPASFWRGGTSNGLLFHRKHLPNEQSEWQPLLTAAMGSPDPFGRQLNGMGGGVSSLSKICIVEPSKRGDADVDYTFIQLGIKEGDLDMAGNCGNMSSSIGPFAFNEGLVQPEIQSENGSLTTTVRIFNTNTSKVIHSHFHVEQAESKSTPDYRFKPTGDYSIDGVSGTSSRITLSFLSPGGSKTGKTLPTGRAVDRIETSGYDSIETSLVDAANPGVFVRGSDLGLDSPLPPPVLDSRSEVMARLEAIRAKGAAMMGLDPKIQSIPKIVILFPSDQAARDQGIDIICQALSMGQAHKAVPLTLALNLGVSCKLQGTIPHLLATRSQLQSTIMGYPNGKLEVGAEMAGQVTESAVLYRTARLLMEGNVNCER